MKDLYRGRYLIAVYDREDRCLGVASSIKELKKTIDSNNPSTALTRMLKGEYPGVFHKYHLIDCLESHDDIFKEEDEIFLKEVPEKITDEEKARSLGLSLRTYYRKKASGKEKENEGRSL